MSAEDSRPRFVVFFNRFPRFWSYSREGAEEHRREEIRRYKTLPDSRVEMFEDDCLVRCGVSHANPRQLLFLDDGEVKCPECGRVSMA